MQERENYLTMRDLMDYLKISRFSVYRFIKEGMPNYKFGGMRRFKASEVEEWLKNRQK
jgi:excisionase family DNA binding protein